MIAIEKKFSCALSLAMLLASVTGCGDSGKATSEKKESAKEEGHEEAGHKEKARKKGIVLSPEALKNAGIKVEPANLQSVPAIFV